MNVQQRYQKTQLVGHGPIADVYRGQDTGGMAGRAVVIKKLHDDILRDFVRRDRFFEEAQRWGRTCQDDDHLVIIYDLEPTLGEAIYEPLEYSAADLITRGPSGAEQVAKVLRHAAVGLGNLHGNRVLHLNIKSTNLLFDRDGDVKLTDGRCHSPDDLGELAPPDGSHKYLAPELVESAFGRIAPATDIYCLGFVALELLVGSHFDSLFRGVIAEVGDTDRAWIRWHSSVDETPLKIIQQVPNLPKRLADVLQRMLAKKQLDRYQFVDELLLDLAEAAPPLSIGKSSLEPGKHSTVLTRASITRAPPVPAKLSGAPAGRQPLLSDVPIRPESSILIRIVSGQLGGQFVSVGRDDFLVGGTADCHIQLSPNDYPAVSQMSMRFSRTVEGWRVESTGGHQFLLNQDISGQPALIRSGDMVRMTFAGPVLQFIVQPQRSVPLNELAATYAPLMLKSPAGGASPKRSAPAVPAEVAAGHPSSPAPPSRKAAPPVPPGPAAPSRPQPSPKRAPPIVPPQPKSIVATAKNSSNHAYASTGLLARFQAMDKSKRNNWIAVIGVIVMAIVILMWPSSSDPKKPEDTKTPESIAK